LLFTVTSEHRPAIRSHRDTDFLQGTERHGGVGFAIRVELLASEVGVRPYSVSSFVRVSGVTESGHAHRPHLSEVTDLRITIGSILLYVAARQINSSLIND